MLKHNLWVSDLLGRGGACAALCGGRPAHAAEAVGLVAEADVGQARGLALARGGSAGVGAAVPASAAEHPLVAPVRPARVLHRPAAIWLRKWGVSAGVVETGTQLVLWPFPPSKVQG